MVVDIQEKLAAAMPEDERERVYRSCSRLIQAAGILDIPVMVTEQYPQGIGATAPEISTHLPAGSPILDKTSFSCCGDAGIMKAVEKAGRSQIIICGMESHVCVLQTALLLDRAGFQVFVVEDGVCSRQVSHKNNALQRMRQAGLTMSNFESVIFEWLGNSRHPDFRSILSLVRD